MGNWFSIYTLVALLVGIFGSAFFMGLFGKARSAVSGG